MYEIDRFTPYLEENFDHCPEPAVIRGEVLSAQCIVAVCSQNTVLSLSPKKLRLSVVAIDTTIGNAVQRALQADFGLNADANQRVLFGKFSHGPRHPPSYVVGYFLGTQECEGVLQQSNLTSFDQRALSRAESSVPKDLLGLIVTCDSKRGLGYDVSGKLVHWTPAVEEKVLADIEKQRLEAEEKRLRVKKQLREPHLLAA